MQQGIAEGTIWTRLLLPSARAAPTSRPASGATSPDRSAASRLLLFPLVLALFHPAVRGRPPLFAAALLVLAAVCADFWIFAATPRDFDWHWSTAGVRVLSQTNAATALVVGAMAGAILGDRRGDSRVSSDRTPQVVSLERLSLELVQEARSIGRRAVSTIVPPSCQIAFSASKPPPTGSPWFWWTL